MPTKYMWGEDGQYGPFSAGEDGYPSCGEVVRFYRVLKGYRAIKFAELYGRALGEKPKTRIWVLTMERTNDVPTDITRRRAIADVLGIPYVLLGISENLPKIPLGDTLGDTPAVMPRIPKRETLINEVLTEHEQSLASYVDGYFHRHGQAALGEVTRAAEQISPLLSVAREQTQERGVILISRYHQFGANVAKQQQDYVTAILHGNQAVVHAQEAHKIKPNSDLLAIAFYRRALPSFEQEITRIDQESNYADAISFIDTALFHAQSSTASMNGSISLEWGVMHAYTATSEKERTAARKRLIDSYDPMSQRSGDDNTNFLKGYLSWYHLRYAEALIVLGDYADAIGQLDLAEEFTPLNFPRRFAYIDALRAKAYVGLREYGEAIVRVRDALTESRMVKSEFNIARIAKVYRQLKEGYKHSSDVTELGRELTQTHPHLVLF